MDGFKAITNEKWRRRFLIPGGYRTGDGRQKKLRKVITDASHGTIDAMNVYENKTAVLSIGSTMRALWCHVSNQNVRFFKEIIIETISQSIIRCWKG
jgi:hypothetical protein